MTSRYTFIQRYGEMLGRPNYQIYAEQDQALKDGAPTNAVFRRVDGSWAVTEEVVDLDSRKYLGLE